MTNSQTGTGTADGPLPASITPARSRARRIRLGLVVLILAVNFVLGLGRQAWLLTSDEVYLKDLTQEYLLGRAVLDRLNPYVPLPELAARFLPAAVVPPQPGQHPPFVAFASAPLGLLPYQTATAVWLAFELMLLGAMAYLVLAGTSEIGREAGGREVLVAFIALFAWGPVWSELSYGQINLLVATLLLASWAALTRDRPRLAGILFGASIAVKLFPILLIPFFLLRRPMLLMVAWALATATVLTAVASVVIGGDGVASYLVYGLPATGLWRAAEGNFSLFSAVWRIFAGSISIRPLIPLPALAFPLAALATLAVFAIALHGAARARDPERQLGIGLCTLVVVGPIIWQNYFILLARPIYLLARQMYAQQWRPTRHALLLLFAVVAMSLPITAFITPDQTAGAPFVWPKEQVVPGLVGLPFALLPLPSAIVMWLLLRPRRPRNGDLDG